MKILMKIISLMIKKEIKKGKVEDYEIYFYDEKHKKDTRNL